MSELGAGSPFRLDGKTALVTGAGKGLGRACALAFARAGARVVAVARTEADLASLEAEAPAGAIEPLPRDATAAAFFDEVERLERLDVLLNNLGGNRPGPMVDAREDDIDWALGINLRAPFLTARAAARAMRRQGRGGAILNMSSQMGHVGAANRTVYCMAKHGIEGLTKAMAVELAPDRIRVNAIAPTFILTEMTKGFFENPSFTEEVLKKIPLCKLGAPEDVAHAALYLASDAAAMVTGLSLKVDGGWTAP